MQFFFNYFVCFFLKKKKTSNSKTSPGNLYKDDFACFFFFRLGDKQFKNKCTHSHIDTHEDRGQSGVLELYLNTAELNGEEFSRHGERHIEYTVYVQTKAKKNLSTLITLLEDQEQWPKKQNQQNCKPSLNGAKKKKKKKKRKKYNKRNQKTKVTSIQIHTKYLLAQYDAVPWNAISPLGSAPPAESNPTDRTTQYVTIFTQ